MNRYIKQKAKMHGHWKKKYRQELKEMNMHNAPHNWYRNNKSYMKHGTPRIRLFCKVRELLWADCLAIAKMLENYDRSRQDKRGTAYVRT